MNVEKYSERAKQEIANIANHHDSPRDMVMAALDEMVNYVWRLAREVDAEREKYLSAVKLKETKQNG
jgi:hypothetical protein